MTDLLNSLKSDLLDRRFLPFLALLGAALIAALAYAVLGGGSSSPTTPAAGGAPSGVGASAGVAISKAPAKANVAVAETTNASSQSPGKPRNPFAPQPGAKTATSTKSSSSSSTSASKSSAGASNSSSSGSTPASSGSGKATSGSGGAPATTPHPSAPAKPLYYIHYHVSAQFGPLPAATPGAAPPPAQLKTYTDMKLDEPLPDKSNPQLVFLGVVLKTGKEAVFALTGEPILNGSAACKPSPSQCQAIELRAGQSERLEVTEASGQTLTYELKLLSIAKTISSGASAARAHSASHLAVSPSGRALLGHNGVPTLAQLNYAAQPGGGLAYAGHPAFAAHAARR